MQTLELEPQTRVPVRRRIVDHPALSLGIVGAVVGFAGSWIPSYWGDEAATVVSATRSLPSLLGLLARVDGVHGVYYALMHVWIAAFGTSELSTRLPSALAVGAMVAGTVVLARGLAGTRIAVLAGIVCIVLPRSTFMAGEARSYALGAAAAVWITVLLVRLVRTTDAVPPASHRLRPTRAWFGYAAAIAAAMYLFLYLGLLLVVHLAFVAMLHRRALGQWMRAAATALLLALPILVIGYLQRRQIAFLAERSYANAVNVLVKQWFGSPVLAVIAWALVVVAIVGTLATTRLRRASGAGQQALVVLGALWLVVPTAVLLVVNATVSPAYNVRYLSFCTPAAAVLIAVGAMRIAGWIGGRSQRSTVVAAVLVGAVVAGSIPVYLSQRSPFAKDGGSDLRAVAEAVRSSATPGDAVIFDQTTKPSRDPRLGLDLYPSDYAGLDDAALVTPLQDRTWLWDKVSSNASAIATIPRSIDVWAVELTRGTPVPADVHLLETAGYRLVSAELIHRTTIYHFTRR